MRFFELHFNPQKIDTPDFVFDSFCYTPENVYERKLGYLFAAGELKNVLWQNVKLLDSLALELKKRYYSGPLKSSPETSLKESLRKANEFLENLAKQGEVSWLGNLNFVVLNLTQGKRDVFDINFAKVGGMKVLLLRPGKIMDIGKDLEYSEIEPYPLKVFGNIVSGKLAKDDVVAVLTKEVFDFFAEKNLLAEIARITPELDFGKKLREILKKRESELSKISGLLLLCLLTKEEWLENKKGATSLLFQKTAEKFSLTSTIKKALLPAISRFKKNLRFRVSLPSLPFAEIRQKVRALGERLGIKKNVILVLLLLFLLLLGFLLF